MEPLIDDISHLSGPNNDISHASDQRVLVTGATGAIGGAIARMLVAQGTAVRALSRRGSDRSYLGDSVEWFEGDVREAGQVRRAVEGCDAIYHCAGFVGPLHYRFSDFEDINVSGTRNVIESAIQAGVRRVVHTSSIAAIGGKGGEVADESTVDGDLMAGYPQSKRSSEELALAATSRGLEVVSVNPAVVYGPRERYFSRLIRMHVKGRLKVTAYPERMIPLAYLGDVAATHILAMESGVSGERYIVCGQSVSLGEFLSVLSSASGVSEPRWTAPNWLVKAAIGVGRATSPITRKRPPLRISDLSTLGPTYDGSKAAEKLGLNYTPLEDGLAKTVAWLRG
ncbi:MAG: SDR family NAD(P)-dependent oxidoreductase [Chloroflexi bacterium]|nr:SDR family NAD(P)-dependent oxidoreductase [Chloroflexota bacterium]